MSQDPEQAYQQLQEPNKAGLSHEAERLIRRIPQSIGHLIQYVPNLQGLILTADKWPRLGLGYLMSHLEACPSPSNNPPGSCSLQQ